MAPNPPTRLLSMLTILTPREAIILTLRYRHEMTQEEIGGEIGLSKMHVSRLIADAMEKLRTTPGGFLVEFVEE